MTFTPPGTTLEQAGMAGSSFVMSPAEVEAYEAAERERVEKGNALIDAAIAAVQHPPTVAERLHLIEARLDALEAAS
jgi:hypothetical protein